MRNQLQALAQRFEAIAMPRRGRYVRKPALMDEHGVISVPPPVPDPLMRTAAVIASLAAVSLAGLLIARRRRRRLA
jgi:hypothetical protein